MWSAVPRSGARVGAAGLYAPMMSDSTDRDPEGEPLPWRSLAAGEKRKRVLAVAGELFAEEGVEFPMPALAKKLGIGVGSIYRQVGSKDDVLAELVMDRLKRFEVRFREAAAGADPVAALDEVVLYTLEQTLQDRVAKMSFELGLEREDVAEVRASAAGVLSELLEASKAAGGIRQDAEIMDLRVMFRIAREAEKMRPGQGRRIAALIMGGLRPGVPLGPPHEFDVTAAPPPEFG